MRAIMPVSLHRHEPGSSNATAPSIDTNLTGSLILEQIIRVRTECGTTAYGPEPASMTDTSAFG